MKNNTSVFLETYQELEYNIELSIFKLFRKNKIKEDEVIDIELPNGNKYGVYVHKVNNVSEIRIKDKQRYDIVKAANQYDVRLLIDIFDVLENNVFNS